ncbi:GDSL-type esterase/lipase family protein, partial [Streptomyces sp. SA3_actF]|uniref:GDSL-type esterase/lipase family protein n=1 Tax=Streptomyces sp. SA3_actF TaxID=682181 RepID=UPI001F33928A
RPLSRRGFLLVGAGAAAGVAFGARPAAADVPGESNGGVRVMPLGDSLTDGFTPCPGGYRIGLWRRLAEAGYTVDFVGSLANGPAELGDHDHEGHSGWRIDQLDAQLDGWLAATSPRTVLLLIGTNDLNQNHDVANAPRGSRRSWTGYGPCSPPRRSSWPRCPRRPIRRSRPASSRTTRRCPARSRARTRGCTWCGCTRR